LHAKYIEDDQISVNYFKEQMKLITRSVLCILLCAGILNATPFIANGGFITPQGKNDIKANLFYCQYTGSYNSSGIYSAFAPGVARMDYTALFDLKYGTGRDADVQVLLPYMNKFYTFANGSTIGAIGVGDMTVIGRQKSNESKTSEGMLTVGVGVKVPTGKSYFNMDKNTLATGTGTWDAGAIINMQENTSGILLYTDVSYWYRFGLNIQKFAGYDISAIKAGETEVKFTPGMILKYNFGAELPIIKQLSIIGEVNGEVCYENKAEYASNNADAMNDLLAKGAPDYTLDKSVNLRVTAGIKGYLGDKISIGGGVSIPVNMVNAFGNMTYVLHCRLFF